MTNRTHHVFFSYARADNGADNNHFVTHFHDLLCKEHQSVTGRELKTFFDTEAIEEGEHWKTRLGQGLRDSRLFLAFLSDNYLKSPVCKWEWEHYLLTEHTAARGEDGVVPLYFIPIDDLGKATEEQLAEWVNEIKQRNLGAYCQLQPWYKAGSDRARELDAADRAIGLREVDVESEGELTLPERIRRLNLRICRRLDRIHLAEQVIGNVVRPYRHFVGRHKQLRQLHEALTVDQTSLLATVHSPGGLGKSALARQYAIAYADFYAAGGVWELKCASLGHLGDALRQLEQQEELRKHGFNLEEDREKTADEQAQSALAQLKRITHSRRDTVNQQLRDLKNRHTPEDQLEVSENSRCLLILDNVDKTELLAADQLGLIPAEDWLSVIVTTRLSPDSFGAASSLRSIEVPPLSLIEGKELLRTFMPGEVFTDAEEAKTAEELVKALDGYTYALELIGASVAVGWEMGDRLSNHLEMLEDEGLASTDELGEDVDVQARIQYRNKQISLIVEDTLSTLRERLTARYGADFANAAQQIIEMASLLQPDTIPGPWLQALLNQTHPDLKTTRKRLAPWRVIRQAFVQLSLLSPAERHADSDDTDTDVLRMHRVTAAHIASNLPEEGECHWNQIKSYLDRLTDWMEQDSSLETLAQRNQHQQWLIAQAPHLLDKHPNPKILRSLHVAVDLEGTHRSLSLAIELAESIRKHREAVLARNPDSAEAARDLSISQDMLGSFFLQRGQENDGDRALGYYEAALKTRAVLWKCDPASAQAANDLSASNYNLGNFYMERLHPDDAERALRYYKAALEITNNLYVSNANDLVASRNLLLLEDKLGDHYLNHSQPNDPEGALGYYKISVGIAENIIKQAPDSAEAVRDLAYAQNKLGDFYLQRGQSGDAELARDYVEEALQGYEKLYKNNPNSRQAARDLSFSLTKLGEIFIQREQPGDDERALNSLRRALKIDEEQYTSNPDDSEIARDLSISRNKLGDFYLQSKPLADTNIALEHYEASLKCREELYRRNPENISAAHDLSVSYAKLGRLYAGRGESADTELAIMYYLSGKNILKYLYSLNPCAETARELAVSLNTLGDLHLQRDNQGDTKVALDYVKAAAETFEDLFERGHVSVASCHRLVTFYWNVVMLAQQLDESEKDFHMACSRCHQLLRAMKEKNIALDPNCDQILANLDQMASSNQSQ